MTRHEPGGVHRHALGLERAHRRQRRGHERGLGVLGERQLVLLAVPDDVGQLDPQRLVDLVEHGAGCGISLGKVTPHADGLCPLSRKNECAGHVPSRFIMPPFR